MDLEAGKLALFRNRCKKLRRNGDELVSLRPKSSTDDIFGWSRKFGHRDPTQKSEAVWRQLGVSCPPSKNVSNYSRPPQSLQKAQQHNTISIQVCDCVFVLQAPRNSRERKMRLPTSGLSSALTRPALWVSTLCSFSFSLNSVTLLSLTLAPSLCPQPQSHRPAVSVPL